MSLLSVEHLWHRYPASDWSLRDITFDLEEGQLLGLLGPSGCGKTTLLRLIAGFEQPSRGLVRFDGVTIATPEGGWPPERRGVGMVFQDYALFPHLRAWQNAGFGCRSDDSRRRAAGLLQQLGLEGLEQRYPHELSGGQRQRLALVRALAPGPRLLLLDEPFSNLDVEVRQRLRAELPAVLAACGVSAVLVTHDPGEALAICDRVAVLRQGCWHQCSAPRDLVRDPATAFVGRFVLQANVLPLQRLQALPDGGGSLGVAGLRLDPASQVLLRQESLAIEPCPDGEAQVMSREFLGHEWLYQVNLRGLVLRLRAPLHQALKRGSPCQLSLRPGEQPLVFPPAEESAAERRSVPVR
jgi:iron(III) transport system ATP-binding protein